MVSSLHERVPCRHVRLHIHACAGRPNLDSVLGYLTQNLGLAAAAEVILTGGSAGGTSVFLALDHVATLVPPKARFVGVSVSQEQVTHAIPHNPCALTV